FSGMEMPTETTRASTDRWQTIEVKAVRLDDAIPKTLPVNFIKLDVEGAEELALKGAVQTIRRCKPAILFESVPGGAERYGRSRRDLFDLITGTLEYDVWFIVDYLERGEPTDWARFDESHTYPFQACNYLALPRR
ncbi:MAG: FkbM family methyltransferase, partial [Planctomycetota bacterium]|nr:FkbM family methyltransferase [Planctomycetota bacterium]